VLPAAEDGSQLTMEPGARGTTLIRSTALDFIKWSTTRKPWRDYCDITGDARTAARFLDYFNIV
jgi:hypothetical protein